MRRVCSGNRWGILLLPVPYECYLSCLMQTLGEAVKTEMNSGKYELISVGKSISLIYG
ncbi:MAG: hypothetical protein ACLU4J_02815 [Butyricimonas paravirosa]